MVYVESVCIKNRIYFNTFFLELCIWIKHDINCFQEDKIMAGFYKGTIETMIEWQKKTITGFSGKGVLI